MLSWFERTVAFLVMEDLALDTSLLRATEDFFDTVLVRRGAGCFTADSLGNVQESLSYFYNLCFSKMCVLLKDPIFY